MSTKYTPVSDASLLQAGTEVQVEFSFSYVPFTAPDESQIRKLLVSVPSLSILTLDTPGWFSGSGVTRTRGWKLSATVNHPITAREIKAEIETVLEEPWNIYSVGFMEFTRGSFSFIPDIPEAPVTTTVMVVGIAIIAVVGLVLLSKTEVI